MKKTKIAILTAAATLFALLASLVSSGACWWGIYQPEEPASLREE